MICPHCNYDDITGAEGLFYMLHNSANASVMSRESREWGKDDRVPLRGCPRCHRLFIGETWET